MTASEFAAWVAPTATMVAAVMTAANLGSRVTGWGFVVFTIGSVAWALVGFNTGQANLLATNGFLTLVNLIGIWRWLGRQRAYEDGAASAKSASRRAATRSLFAATGIAGMPVVSAEGDTLGAAVEALLECDTGQINYVVVASDGVAGVGEHLRAVPRADVEFGCDELVVTIPTSDFRAIAVLEDGDWPADVRTRS